MLTVKNASCKVSDSGPERVKHCLTLCTLDDLRCAILMVCLMQIGVRGVRELGASTTAMVGKEADEEGGRVRKEAGEQSKEVRA